VAQAVEVVLLVLLVHRRVQVDAGNRAVGTVVVEVREVATLDDGGEHRATDSGEVDDLVAGLVTVVVRVVGRKRVHHERHRDTAIGLDA